jgi:hypothetical protein
VDGGDRAFDTVTNSRLSPTAGLFGGLGGWEPDATAASVSLYGYHEPARDRQGRSDSSRTSSVYVKLAHSLAST